MKNDIETYYPEYFSEFECIGGSCTDSCCIGWDVDIDKITFKKYYKTNNLEMKKMFQKNLYNNEYCCSPDIDYGRVKLKKGKRCPFLDTENYCTIYTNLGEDYLSNVCTCFPRTVNKVDDHYEISLDVSCPEAAKLLLLKKEQIKFKHKKMNSEKWIISGEINTKDKKIQNTPLNNFNELRNKSIEILQDRSMDLTQRLYKLGLLLETVQESFENDEYSMKSFIKEYDLEDDDKNYEQNNMNYIIQIGFFENLIEMLNIEEVDSESFKEYTTDVIESFKLKTGIDEVRNNAHIYIKHFEEYINNIINSNSHVFENYFVNSMYKDLFPFSESENVFDGYIMLLVRYSFLRFYLIGRYIKDKKESSENIAHSIQIFSKTTEHHKTYLIDVLEYIKENEFDNMEFAKVLL